MNNPKMYGPDRKKTGQDKLLKLEAIRGAAALYVILHHTFNSFFAFGWDLSLLFRFGQEAVILFFIISGFVIEISFSKGKDKSFSTYFTKRLIRIYIPLLCVFMANYALVLFQSDSVRVSWTDFLLNMLMLQDLDWIKPNVIVAPLFGNSPLWSLSYEWWFYMLYFPIMRFFPQKSSQIVYGLGVIAAGTYVICPNFINRELMYLVIWWSGVVLARLYAEKEKITLLRLLPLLTIMVIISIVLVLNVIVNYEEGGVGLSPILEVRHFFFAVFAILVSLFWCHFRWLFFDQLMTPFIQLAPISYGLYISHYFMISNATYLDDLLFAQSGLRLLLYSIICFGFSWLVERVVYVKINRAYRKKYHSKVLSKLRSFL
ncbi:acyltransferase family protein [Neolewinella agarilytica]|uniref:acyltransferase family protein n=1 Tax=Neolewinella agarilytica TaxID=478744 RepID=UPI0023521E38|nr:acyltransferase [Neolewinella agarilytica]